MAEPQRQPEQGAARLCDVADCGRPVHARGFFCAAHAKRKQRGSDVNEPIRERMSLRERVGHLCDDLANADAENDDEYERAWQALRKALEQWAVSLRQQRAGLARMQSMTPEERSALARKALAARGAFARARSLTKARRIEIARKAAAARYGACVASQAGEASKEAQTVSEQTSATGKGKRRPRGEG